MTRPRISVVVPFYNVADLLGDCLRSIAAQIFVDLEVIMVDDGSTDASSEVARAQAAADPRFTLLQVRNGGPGYARNRGAERARGEFLAFVDGDDMVPPGAYEVLVGTLERSRSDFVCGNVNRIGPWGISQSALHARAIKGRRMGTHITKMPQLLYDISVFNKLFRKDFWDSHQLSFPEGMIWEDLQLMTRAHVLARAVDVIPDHIYYWRERGLGELSITQSRTEISNLRDRIDALLAIDAFLAAHAPADLLRRHQHKALTNDLWLYVGDLYKVGDDYRTEFLDLACRYLGEIRPRVLAKLRAVQKLAYYLIERRLMPELLALLAWQMRQPVRAVPIVRRRGRLLADLPLREDARLRIPAKIFRPAWRELDPFVRVEAVGWRGGGTPRPEAGEAARASGGKLVIEGRAYVPSIDIGKRRHSSKIVVLRPRNRRRPPIIVRARSFLHPDATEQSGQARYSYDWAGFRCEISPRWFRLFGRWATGTWECYVLVRSRGVWRPARIHTPQPGRAERPEFGDVAPGIRLRPKWEGRNLVVQLAHAPAMLAGHHAEPGHDGGAGQIELDVDLSGPPLAAADHATLILARQGGTARVSFPASASAVGPSGAARLSGAIDLAALAAGAEGEPAVAGRNEPAAAGGDEPTAGRDDGDARGDWAGDAAWDVYVSVDGRGRFRVAVPAGSDAADTGAASTGGASEPGGGGTRPVVGTAAAAGQRYLRGGREIAVGWSRYGDLVISDRAPRPIVTDHAWAPGGRLQLRGRYAGPPASLAGVVLRRHGSSEVHRLPCTQDGDTFTAEIDANRMPSFGEQLPLRDGRWYILFDVGAGAGTSAAAEAIGETGTGVTTAFDAEPSAEPAGAEPGAGAGPGAAPASGDGLMAAAYDPARLADVTEQPVDAGAKEYRLIVVGDDTPVLAVTTNLSRLERGRFNQRVLRRAYYPLKLRAPLRDAVVFMSWKGKQCADNPLGIAAELRNRGDDREHIWVVADPAVRAPAGATVVLRGSHEYYEALARSRYLIANDDMPAHYRKRDGQIYLQTWHGTPLKRIGFDIDRPQFVSGAAYLDHLATEVTHWDLLLSQNPFSTQTLRRAFRFDGEICEYGYPRNDVLSRPDAPQLAAAARRRLGLPEGKRVVLYAPTWRDNQFYAAGRYRFDLRVDLERAWKALGDDYMFLIRGHHHMADDVPDGVSSGFAMNVTRYPDISELFLVSDILVTDYSSVMFDYASTGRPMLFFTYDLDDYRDNLRGFYFDFEPEAPGPLLATSDEVIAAIGDIETVAARYAGAYRTFAAKFCPFDDGKAGARVCDRLASA
ncbi:MAG TPA: CDP-glycerol glycerophosphotransferase family protein [Streptosporangiaceae bacterium]|nr:CDP-glycerol glycerophosphotransferase family protein [Streptosporangiaceae bacterium]